jgi:hypothetical protein
VPLLRFTLLCYAIAPSGWQAWTFLLNHAILLLFKGHSMETGDIAAGLLVLVVIALALYHDYSHPSPESPPEDDHTPLWW